MIKKIINEMQKGCDMTDCEECKYFYKPYCKSQVVAEKVAREIFEEIEKPLNEFLSGEGFDWQFADKVAELKKKYIGV